eukprot:NODE_140_length_17926_cov_0.139620.p6 type:complete len:331 gc:universal NODE_140_length_17926_cov_0.139620:11970-12962(+)
MVVLLLTSAVLSMNHSLGIIDKNLRLADPLLIENLKRYLDYSAMSYCLPNLDFSSCEVCNSPRLQNISKIVTFQSEYYKTDSYVAVNDRNREIVITFRGLDNNRQLVQFVNTVLKRMDIPLSNEYGISTHEVKVHSGFLAIFEDSYQVIYTPLIKIIRSNPNHRIVFNGHSLGGALSVLLLIKLVFKDLLDPKRMKIVNFGSPRIGNKPFALLVTRLVRECWRVTHGHDVVPKSPPRFLGYHHFPNEIWLVDVINIPKSKDYTSDAFKPSLKTPFETINTKSYVCDLFDDRRCSISTGSSPFVDEYLHLVYWNLISSSQDFGRCFYQVKK